MSEASSPRVAGPAQTANADRAGTDRAGADETGADETGADDDILVAAAYLSRVAEPASPALWELVRTAGYRAAADAVRTGAVSDEVARCTEARRTSADPFVDLDAAERSGIRLLTWHSADWPHLAFAPLSGQRDSAGGRLVPPLALWVKGTAELSALSSRSVAVVGSRAASAYGEHVAGDWAFELAGAAVEIVSGGAYGIDGAAHRGALAADGVSVLVSAGGLDRPYPAGHRQLYDRVAERGVLVSEHPPGSAPHRQRFLSRNRLIAAFGTVTLVVEAARRSGALNTARYARDLGRPVLAVPGPVTSALSAGCHDLINRDDQPARLAAAPSDVLAFCSWQLTLPGTSSPESAAGGLSNPHDELPAGARAVLDGFPARGTVTEAELARLSGQPIAVVIASLPTLVELGLIRADREGYRLAKSV